MPKMDVPQPVYNWLLIVKAELSGARQRQVTWPEVFEWLKSQQQAADQVTGAGR